MVEKELETFTEPDKEKKLAPNLDEKPIPPYSFSLQHTHFRKIYVFAMKYYGQKVVKDEEAHIDHICKEPSICKKLWGIGQTLNQMGIRLQGITFNQLDNHVWITQTNLSDPDRKPMEICVNCGSLIIEDMFIPYTRLQKDNGD